MRPAGPAVQKAPTDPPRRTGGAVDAAWAHRLLLRGADTPLVRKVRLTPRRPSMTRVRDRRRAGHQEIAAAAGGHRHPLDARVAHFHRVCFRRRWQAADGGCPPAFAWGFGYPPSPKLPTVLRRLPGTPARFRGSAG